MNHHTLLEPGLFLFTCTDACCIAYTRKTCISCRSFNRGHLMECSWKNETVACITKYKVPKQNAQQVLENLEKY